MNGDPPPPREPPDDIAIEPAELDDRLNVLRVLDAAMLETDTDVVDAALAAGDVLVARFTRTDAVVGALVATRPEPARLHIDAVAVRRARRGRGIGSALVAVAVRRAERDAAVAVVTAEFDPKLRTFYTDLGFDLDRGGDKRGDASGADRLRGRRSVESSTDDGDAESDERRR